MSWSFKKKPAAEGARPLLHERATLRQRMPGDEDSIQDVEIEDIRDVPGLVVETMCVPLMAEGDLNRDPAPAEAPATAVSSHTDTESAQPVIDDSVADSAALHDEVPTEVKKSRWLKSAKGEKAVTPTEISRPIKVLIGFLPDASEKDTYFYMLGVAQKNLDSENIGWAALQRFENGFAYEIHEGGSGRGYLDSLLEHFRSLPSFSAEETHRAHIRTATRTVRVERTATGLYSVILPESDTTPQSDWLTPGKKLAALVEKRTGLFLGGVVIFLSSLLALMGAYATRYQPYTPVVVSLERVAANKLPHAQWNRLTNLAPGDYVQALRYEHNEWIVQTPSNPSGKIGGARPNAVKPAPGAIALSPSTPELIPAARIGAAPLGINSPMKGTPVDAMSAADFPPRATSRPPAPTPPALKQAPQ
jgi:hypothetical protein